MISYILLFVISDPLHFCLHFLFKHHKLPLDTKVGSSVSISNGESKLFHISTISVSVNKERLEVLIDDAL